MHAELKDRLTLAGSIRIEKFRRNRAGVLVPVPLWPDRDDLFLELPNLITQFGDQWYAERAWEIGSHVAPTGMRLGSGTTAAAKTGAGAAIVTYQTGSSLAIDGSFPTSGLSGSKRRIVARTTWDAGVATNESPGIAEAVITVESPLTNVAGVAGNTISRVTFTAVPKAALDVLSITWNHDAEGT